MQSSQASHDEGWCNIPAILSKVPLGSGTGFNLHLGAHLTTLSPYFSVFAPKNFGLEEGLSKHITFTV